MNPAGWIVLCSVLSSIAVCFVVEIKKIKEEASTNE